MIQIVHPAQDQAVDSDLEASEGVAHLFNMVTKQELKRLYWKKNMTYKEIAKYLGFPNGARVQHLMEKYNISRRKQSKRNQYGLNNTNWNGGKKTLNGYIMIRKVDHPRNVNGYVPKHILIMEEKLGRRLKLFGFNNTNNETVHHINGNKKDNRIDNLKLMKLGDHVGLHNKLRDYSNTKRNKQTGRFIKCRKL
jgi:hypothetical protein